MQMYNCFQHLLYIYIYIYINWDLNRDISNVDIKIHNIGYVRDDERNVLTCHNQCSIFHYSRGTNMNL